MFISYGVKDVWAFGFMFFAFYPFFGLAVAWAKGLHLLVEPMLSFSVLVSFLANDPAISLHHAYYNFTLLFTSCYPMNLWANVPAVLAHFFVNPLLRAS